MYNRSYTFICLTGLLFTLTFPSECQTVLDYTHFVNTFIGTAPLNGSKLLGYPLAAGRSSPVRPGIDVSPLSCAMLQLNPIAAYGSGAEYQHEDINICCSDSDKGHRTLCNTPILPVSSCPYPSGPVPGHIAGVSRLFSDHMVLQQKAKVNVWGWSTPGAKVGVMCSWGKKITAITRADGTWHLKLATPRAGGPYTMFMQTAGWKIEIKDVMIGEVWLASGQSNMDIPLLGWPPGDTINNSAQEISLADYPAIRFLKVPFGISNVPLDSTVGKWTPSSSETAGYFSATAYFFARALYKKLKVPLGIIQSSIGGTPAEAWTSKESLLKIKEFKSALKDTSNRGPVELNSNTPSVLFNAMINPLIPFTIKGIIWYQGESNVGRAEQYKLLFPILIEDWRHKWKNILPFYYVQLSPYLYTAADQHEQGQKLRDAQRYALKLPKTGMVTTLDIGYLKTAHPPNKQEVGERLARFALKNDYGYKNLVASGPIYKKTTFSGSKLILEFKFIGSGLIASPNGLYNFEIAGKDKGFVKADVKIEKNKLILSNTLIVNPVFARYAWSDSSTGTLFNKEGLPAATFTTAP